MQLNGAQAVLKALEHEGVDTVFGMPGGAILPVYDPLLDSSIRHILATLNPARSIGPIGWLGRSGTAPTWTWHVGAISR